VVDARLRVVVTGGAGFIGSRLARTYAERAWPTLVVDDLSGGRADALPPDVELAVADVADPTVASTIAAFRPDLVIHAAAQVSVPLSIADPERDRAVNVAGTAHVVEGARDGLATRFVFLSSGGAVYGESDGADESTPPAPKSPYGRSKLEAEAIVRASGLSAGIARLANVYGPGQRTDLEGGVVAIFVERLLAGLPVDVHGDGRQRRDFVHVDDVARAVGAIAASPLDGTWNVATGTATTVLDLLALVRRLTGATSAAIEVPTRDGDVTVSRLSIERIGRDLGWQPRYDLEAGLAATIAAARTGLRMAGS
jgi:UDP-glucose 4-epimerase